MNNRLTPDAGLRSNRLSAKVVRPCGTIPLAKEDQIIVSYSESYYVVPSSIVSIISFFHDRDDKVIGDGFKEVNQCLENKNICPTLEVDGIITLFA